MSNGAWADGTGSRGAGRARVVGHSKHGMWDTAGPMGSWATKAFSPSQKGEKEKLPNLIWIAR
jgi:hypothetical protein